MARRPVDQVALTLRIREDLRKRLERQAEKNEVSLNAEIENRLKESFELANTRSLIRVLTGGGHLAEILAAIAKVFDERIFRQPHKFDEANRLRVEAAYIALILIFTDLLSTAEQRLDPADAAEVVAVRQGHGALEATAAQMEGVALATAVLAKTEYISLLEDSDPDDRGLLAWPGKPLGEWIAGRAKSKKRKAKK